MFPKFNKNILRKNPVEFGALALFAVVIIIFRDKGIFPILLFMELAGILAALYRVIRKFFRQDKGLEESQQPVAEPLPMDSQS